MSNRSPRSIYLIAAGLVLLGGYFLLSNDDQLPFPELTGPAQPSLLPPAVLPRTSVAQYAEGDVNSLAILVNDENASWLGLAHGLKSLGLPFRVVSDADEALLHDVVMVYPLLSGANTSPEILRKFADHVRDGKTLIAFSVLGGGMSELFGFGAAEERNNLSSLRFNSSQFNDQFVVDTAESSIGLKSYSGEGNGLSGVSYSDLKHAAVASFEDGSAAITHNFYSTPQGLGHAYAIGMDFGHYILRGHGGRFDSFAETYVNAYQPKIDTLLRFIENVYRQGESEAVTLYPTPFNKSFTALITHDIDFLQSINNVPTYARFERLQNVPATYFIQTKYITDYSEAQFFDASKVPILQELLALNMEVASHSVSHSNEFKSMPQGNGDESYPSYQPFVSEYDEVRKASIAGELRISKFLLESKSGQQVVAFRPGHLSLPESLPQMLESTGYRYSSSISANSALTHLPYQTMFNRRYDTESTIFEFPVTIEDEEGRLGSRLNEAIEIANNIGRNGGLVNLLIHTDIIDHKFEFEKGFVEQFKDQAWFSTVSDFGDWWVARDSVTFAITAAGERGRVLRLTVDGTIDGLTLILPNDWRYINGPPGTSQQGDRLLLGEFSSVAEVEFDIVGGK